jgi:hypothetical protein
VRLAVEARGARHTVVVVNDFVLHREAVWRNRANSVVCAELSEKHLPRRFEQLFAKRIAEDLFEVCCIPFLLNDLALGDVVATAPMGDLEHVVTKVVEPSGRYVFRVRFNEASRPRGEIAEELRALGSLIEWSSRDLLALDAIDQEHAQRVVEFLAAREKTGQLTYDTGHSR